VVRRIGGPEVLEVEERSVPEPRRGQVRLRVLAAGVAYGDLMRAKGVMPVRRPFTPGYDVVGEIDAVGPGVSDERLGARVGAILPAIGTGGYAEHVCVAAKTTVPVPDAVSADVAVALGVNYISARQILHGLCRIQSGQTVLVHGASGGVGTALVDVAVLAGANVWGTASAAKHDVVRARGAVPIDYRTEDFVERVLAETDGGVDHVTESVGPEQLDRSVAATRRGGTVVFFGLTTASGPAALLRSAWTFVRLWATSGRRLRFYGFGSTPGSRMAVCVHDWTSLLTDAAAGQLNPLIGARVPLLEAASAHDLLGRGAVTGKIVLMG